MYFNSREYDHILIFCWAWKIQNSERMQHFIHFISATKFQSQTQWINFPLTMIISIEKKVSYIIN